MVWHAEIGAYVHWLPVTKVQFEYFLCDVPDAHFDAGWYDAVLRLNPRVTPRKINVNNYYRALMTGIRPAEAQRFASWCGDGYRLPTEREWTELYRSRENQRPEPLDKLLEGREARVCELLQRLDYSVREICDRLNTKPSLAVQMLLRFGAMEWVLAGASQVSWSYKGEPLPEFCGNLEDLDRSADALAIDPGKSRLAVVGFRLLYVPRGESISQTESVHGD